MYFVDYVHIDGFWGDHRVSTNLNSDVNFLIGVNGSGKTTFINLLAAALNADLFTLERFEFNTIRIVLSSRRNKKKPEIRVSRTLVKDLPFPNIEYTIQDSQKSQIETYSLAAIYEDETLESEYRRHLYSRRRGYMRAKQRGIKERLSKLLNHSWLSVHRASNHPHDRDDRHYENTVDQKLSSLRPQLSRYFTSLNTQRDKEIQQFQEFIFLSLLDEVRTEKLSNQVVDAKLESQKNALREIFESFDLSKSMYEKKLSDFYQKASGSITRASSSPVEVDDLIMLFAISRIDSIVDEWKQLSEKTEVIFSAQTRFFDIMNSLLQRKQIQLNDEKDITVRTQSGKSFLPDQMSSGEKQMLILLGETLLQKNEPWIYIADEPEISLHIKWQESLVENIRSLNENAQIIFATHSPDIVSTFDEHTIDMEKLIE